MALHTALSTEQQTQILEYADKADSARQAMEALQDIYLTEGDNDWLILGNQMREI